jgi:hypothetical protein
MSALPSVRAGNEPGADLVSLLWHLGGDRGGLRRA